jgi:O-antigen/teichoic acid export membrane protein
MPSIVDSIKFKTIEKFLTQIISLLINIFLTRLLFPSDFGILAILLTFINIFQAMIQVGFKNSLVRKTNLTDEDYSTIFIFLSLCSIVFYILLFIVAKPIAVFYDNNLLVNGLRILSLNIFLFPLLTIQDAMITRNLDYKKSMISSLLANIFAGSISIYLAYKGFGVWALIYYNLLFNFLVIVVQSIELKKIFKLKFSKKLLSKHLKYSLQLSLASLLNSLSQSIQNLVVGKYFSTVQLGYFDKGKQLPQSFQSFISTIGNAIIFPLISKNQDNLEQNKKIIRISYQLYSYILTPVCLGLVAISDDLVIFLFTAKWIAVIPYLRLFAIFYLIDPLHYIALDALIAIGKSDLYLKIKISMLVFQLSGLLFIGFFETPLYLAYWNIIIPIVAFIVYGHYLDKFFKISLFEQFKYLLGNLLVGSIMCASVYTFSTNIVISNLFIKVIIEILLGFLVYLLGSILFKLDGFKLILASRNLKK